VNPSGRLVDDLLDRCRFPSGSPCRLGVSGGADSLAMLVLARAAGLEVTAIHVDHGLRPGGDGEAAQVAEAARRVGARFEARTATVEPGPNLEARARDARHATLPAGALLGHTADDQAETVLLQLLRGAGPDGLAGMRPDRRPILGLRRAETRAVCAEVGLVPFDDPSNADPRFRRNRIRHEVLPLLAEVSGRDVVPLLVRAAGHQRAVTDLVGDLAAGIDPSDTAVLGQLPEAVATAALRRWWRERTGSAYAPDAAALARVMAVARGVHGATEVTGGWRCERRRGRLWLTPPTAGIPASR
jgi:tRNA(Ile)-lysidine synthase